MLSEKISMRGSHCEERSGTIIIVSSRATKMVDQEGANRSDSLKFCGILFYDDQVRTMNDAAAVCAMTRYKLRIF